MQREESRYPKDWFRIGDSKLKRAQYLLDGGDLEGAGFNIQQAVEKYLRCEMKNIPPTKSES